MQSLQWTYMYIVSYDTHSSQLVKEVLSSFLTFIRESWRISNWKTILSLCSQWGGRSKRKPGHAYNVRNLAFNIFTFFTKLLPISSPVSFLWLWRSTWQGRTLGSMVCLLLCLEATERQHMMDRTPWVPELWWPESKESTRKGPASHCPFQKHAHSGSASFC